MIKNLQEKEVMKISKIMIKNLEKNTNILIIKEKRGIELWEK
jgi:hypothetical protein